MTSASASFGFLGRLLKRPELGAVAGTVLVLVLFALTAGSSGLFSPKGVVNFMEVSAQLGIIASAAALLMIAGEFDLSIGSMIGFAGLVIAIPAISGAGRSGRPCCSPSPSRLVGYLNGAIVVKTGLPSFIVTLGCLFMLRGLELGADARHHRPHAGFGHSRAAAGDWLSPVLRPVFGTLMSGLSDST